MLLEVLNYNDLQVFGVHPLPATASPLPVGAHRYTPQARSAGHI